jgi:hypothetical protein
MYTKLDDIKHANKIKEYMVKNPVASRKDIMIDCITNSHRLKQLEQLNLITLPMPIPYGMRNGKNNVNGR